MAEGTIGAVPSQDMARIEDRNVDEVRSTRKLEEAKRRLLLAHLPAGPDPHQLADMARLVDANVASRYQHTTLEPNIPSPQFLSYNQGKRMLLNRGVIKEIERIP